MSLDDKLRAILIERSVDLVEDFEHALDLKPFIADIKQAFADEGYKKVIDVSPDIALWGNKRLMTGEKWYSRFEARLMELPGTTPVGGDFRELILKIAKKASGL